MIPNATSFINEGYNPITFHPSMPKDDRKLVLKQVKALGKTFKTDERKLESYAIISAMLPTYFGFNGKRLKRSLFKPASRPTKPVKPLNRH